MLRSTKLTLQPHAEQQLRLCFSSPQVQSRLKLLGFQRPTATSGNPKTIAELKAAFRERCKHSHPDCGGTERQFRELSEAYSALLAEHTLNTEQQRRGMSGSNYSSNGYPNGRSSSNGSSSNGYQYQNGQYGFNGGSSTRQQRAPPKGYNPETWDYYAGRSDYYRNQRGRQNGRSQTEDPEYCQPSSPMERASKPKYKWNRKAAFSSPLSFIKHICLWLDSLSVAEASGLAAVSTFFIAWFLTYRKCGHPLLNAMRERREREAAAAAAAAEGGELAEGEAAPAVTGVAAAATGVAAANGVPSNPQQQQHQQQPHPHLSVRDQYMMEYEMQRQKALALIHGPPGGQEGHGAQLQAAHRATSGKDGAAAGHHQQQLSQPPPSHAPSSSAAAAAAAPTHPNAATPGYPMPLSPHAAPGVPEQGSAPSAPSAASAILGHLYPGGIGAGGVDPAMSAAVAGAADLGLASSHGVGADYVYNQMPPPHHNPLSQMDDNGAGHAGDFSHLMREEQMKQIKQDHMALQIYDREGHAAMYKAAQREKREARAKAAEERLPALLEARRKRKEEREKREAAIAAKRAEEGHVHPTAKDASQALGAEANPTMVPATKGPEASPSVAAAAPVARVEESVETP